MSNESMVQLCLYVAGDLPNSRRAIASLRAFCGTHLAGRHELEVVDVLAAPARALSERILLTPQLLITQGDHKQTLIGDLGDHQTLSLVMGVAEGPY